MPEIDLELRELGATRPEAVTAAAARRRRHAMADRGELLDRLTVALSRPGADGVLGTADILGDLLLLGGDPSGAPEDVRGLVVGGTLLYPPDDDVRAAVDTAASLVQAAPEADA